MLINEIVEKIYEAEYETLDIKNINKVHFEISLCEDYGTHQSKTIYKFKKISFNENSIVLYNGRNKVIKVLNKDNCVWINRIYAVDENMRVLLVDYNYTEIEE